MLTARPFGFLGGWQFFGDWQGQVAATAIHAGHDVRPGLAERMILPEDVRFREEDPHTDRIIAGMASRVVVNMSRFEVDLNRSREDAVYRSPEEAWGLAIWRDGHLDDAAARESLSRYDDFYAALAARLDDVAARGPFVIFDVHSYNHRRDGASADPAPFAENPEVNLGTGSLDRERFGGVVEAFIDSLTGQDVSGTDPHTGRLDVRENVKFVGRGLAEWTHMRYPDRGIVLALEFKKTFMDEWTGETDDVRIDDLARALALTVPDVESALRRLS
ncbi:MAG TPA: N-formylglutamate amidohydrolase [Actinomycetaceae bacterium]|nr:N-formylglutamate amidohydrolase [Actinomycetaceae bacterium]